METDTSQDLRDLRILVVDDNATSLEIFKGILDSLNFNSEQVSSGSLALDELQTADPPYDLVLMDWKMPKLDGIETSRIIRKNDQLVLQPKIILVTSLDREESKRQSGNLNLNGHLEKPINPSTLLNAIMNAFGLKSSASLSSRSNKSIDKEKLKAIQGANILLVEDNEINQQLAQELLEGAGFVVELADDGQEAVDKVNSKPYDVVLMDVQMPVLDGYQATRILRKNPDFNELPILAMTANAMVSDKEAALSCGMNDHITKPIDPNQLFLALLKWVKPGERDLPESMSTLDSQPQELEQVLPAELAGLDISLGLMRVNGNQATYLKLLRKFHQNQADSLEGIKNAIASQDMETAIRMAHTLKGVSGNVGAMELHEVAKELEAGLIKEKENVSPALFEASQMKLDQVLTSITSLETLEKTDSGASQQPLDLEEIVPLLDQLHALLEDDDTESADIIQTLKDQAKGNVWFEQLEKVEIAVANYDFEKALEHLVKLKNSIG